MNSHHHVEAKVLKQQGDSTHLLIRAGDSVLQADYSETIPCEFPVWSAAPIHVEVRLDGGKHYVAGLSSENSVRQQADGGLPNAIKFPVYSHQKKSSIDAFENLPGAGVGRHLAATLSREPVAAMAISAVGYSENGKRVESHAVLPIWNEGTAVLVTLNWYDGEESEGTPNPEWFVRSTDGMPLETALRNLQEMSLLPKHASNCRFCLNLSPWKLGTSVLDNPGREVPHKVWQREWQYDDPADFRIAVGRVCDLLAGVNATEMPSMVAQRV